MKDPRDCPECGSQNTESVDQIYSEKNHGLLDERICNDCNCAFDVHWIYKKMENLGTDL